MTASPARVSAFSLVRQLGTKRFEVAVSLTDPLARRYEQGMRFLLAVVWFLRRGLALGLGAGVVARWTSGSWILALLALLMTTVVVEAIRMRLGARALARALELAELTAQGGDRYAAISAYQHAQIVSIRTLPPWTSIVNPRTLAIQRRIAELRGS